MATSELEKTVKEIRQGKTIVLFPPGIWHLAFTIVFTIIGYVFFVGATLQLFMHEQPISVVAIIQLSSLAIPIICAVLPGAMILMGRKWFALWLRCFIFALAFLVIIVVAYVLATQQNQQVKSLLISLGFCAAAIWLSSRAKFLLLCEFFFLLKRPDERR